MANKRWSEVRPNHDDKDSSKEGIKSSARTKPASDPSTSSCKGPTVTRGGAPSGKGGKDLPSPKFEEKKHQSPSGKLP